MFETLDKHVSQFSESFARKMNRRKAMTTAAKAIFASTAGLALGQIVDIHAALAQACTCDWAGGSGNANCPKTSGCPQLQGCPSGCTACTKTDNCGGLCIYPQGYWYGCTGGPCGYGRRYCTDCKCPGCNNVCTCLSEWYCYGCCTPHDVEAEIRRITAQYGKHAGQVAVELLH
jgi:hypothetical protein